MFASLKNHQKLLKKIDLLIDVYLGKVDKRQGITRNIKITVNQRLDLAKRYVSSRFGLQTKTEKQLTNHFKKAFEKALNKTTIFFNSDWKTYKSSTENIKILPFKELELFSLEE